MTDLNKIYSALMSAKADNEALASWVRSADARDRVRSSAREIDEGLVAYHRAAEGEKRDADLAPVAWGITVGQDIANTFFLSIDKEEAENEFAACVEGGYESIYRLVALCEAPAAQQASAPAGDADD